MDVLGHDRREGLGRRAESRASLVVLIVASGVLLLSSLYSAEASVFRKARESVMDTAAPLLDILSRPVAYIQNLVGDVRDYFDVLEQNEALRRENAELRQWMHEALSLRETVAVYERLQGYHAPPEAMPIEAYVIGESNDAFARSMIVNAGAGSGVRRDLAVVDDLGLIGRIVDVGARASRVLLVTDVQSRLPVYVEDANIEGILVGANTPRPSISFTLGAERPTFTPGQRVLTSGAGGALPRGLPVGVIVGARDGEAIVDLYSNFARTRMVRVINYEFAPFEPSEDDPPTGEADDAESQAGPSARLEG